MSTVQKQIATVVGPEIAEKICSLIDADFNKEYGCNPSTNQRVPRLDTQCLQALLDYVTSSKQKTTDMCVLAAAQLYQPIKEALHEKLQQHAQIKRQFEEVDRVVEEERNKHKADIERNVRQRLSLPDSYELFVFENECPHCGWC